MLCASNMNFTIVIPFVVAVRIKGPTLSFPRHTILASFTDTLVSPGSGCNQREARKGSIARLRLERKPGDPAKL